eukprot:366122-Chlamydomonas_euryale.AAC.18
MMQPAHMTVFHSQKAPCSSMRGSVSRFSQKHTTKCSAKKQQLAKDMRSATSCDMHWSVAEDSCDGTGSVGEGQGWRVGEVPNPDGRPEAHAPTGKSAQECSSAGWQHATQQVGKDA